MDPVEEALDDARTSSDDYAFSSALHTLKRQIDGGIQNELHYNIALLDSTTVEHPLLDALQGYQRWVRDQDYENGAERALKKYEEGFEEALSEGWLNVASWALASLIELADSLNHEDRMQRGSERAAELLEEHYSGLDTNEGAAGRVLDAISEANLQSIDNQTLDRLVEFCWARAEYTNKKQNHHSQRKYLRRLRRIQNQREKSIEDVEEALIESYEDEIEFQRTRGHLVTAATIEGAITECESFADEETLNGWRLEKREANKEGMEEEMKSVGWEVSDEEAENFETIVSTLIEAFDDIATQHSPEAAFIGLVKAPVLLPQLEREEPSQRPEEDSDEFATASIHEIFPRRLMTHEGDSVSDEVSDIDIPDSYNIDARLSTALTARVVYKLINQELIREHHFYTLLESIEGATVDDKAFLTDFIIAFFEDRHPEAIHLGMARLEGLLKHQLEAAGTAVTGSKRGEDLPKSLGGIVNRLDGLVDDEYVTYLRFRYHDLVGEALRNRTAHGDLRYKEAHFDISASILVEIFRSTAYISQIETPE